MNNIVAAGGLCGLLWTTSWRGELKSVEVVRDDRGQATNQLRIRFGFLTSAYLVTIERDLYSPETVLFEPDPRPELRHGDG